MPPFNYDAFIIGVDNHSSWCMDSNINHFTKVWWPKNVTFTKGIADGLAKKTLAQFTGTQKMIKDIYIT